MRPRRRIFAADYIADTVAIYRRARMAASRSGETNEIAWARDVLSAYFAAVDHEHPKIAQAAEEFAGEHAPNSRPVMVPYRRDLTRRPVTTEAFMDLCRLRRSVRWYLDRPIPREMIDLAMEAAAQSPSACNRQPFVFRIFDRPSDAQRIAAIPLGTKGFSDKLQAIAVVVGRLRAYPLERDRHAIYVDSALAAMTFMFALESQGLASCPINWPDVEPQESMIAAELGLESDERVIMLIALGWPDPEGLVPYSAKREVEDLRIYG